MIDRSPQRVIRELTPAEETALNAARVVADAETEEILDEARSAKSAWLATRHNVDSMVSTCPLKNS